MARTQPTNLTLEQMAEKVLTPHKKALLEVAAPTQKALSDGEKKFFEEDLSPVQQWVYNQALTTLADQQDVKMGHVTVAGFAQEVLEQVAGSENSIRVVPDAVTLKKGATHFQIEPHVRYKLTKTAGARLDELEAKVPSTDLVAVNRLETVKELLAKENDRSPELLEVLKVQMENAFADLIKTQRKQPGGSQKTVEEIEATRVAWREHFKKMSLLAQAQFTTTSKFIRETNPDVMLYKSESEDIRKARDALLKLACDADTGTMKKILQRYGIDAYLLHSPDTSVVLGPKYPFFGRDPKITITRKPDGSLGVYVRHSFAARFCNGIAATELVTALAAVLGDEKDPRPIDATLEGMSALVAIEAMKQGLKLEPPIIFTIPEDRNDNLLGMNDSSFIPREKLGGAPPLKQLTAYYRGEYQAASTVVRKNYEEQRAQRRPHRYSGSGKPDDNVSIRPRSPLHQAAARNGNNEPANDLPSAAPLVPPVQG